MSARDELAAQATPAREETKRETLARLGMIHLAERYSRRLRLEPSQDNEIRVDITHSGGMETHFPNALDLLESVEAIVEHMGLRKPRTVNSAAELDALPELSVVIDKHDDVSQKRGGQWCGYETADCTSQRIAKYGPLTVLFTPGDAG